MNEQNNLLEAALNYLSLGFSVIPVAGKKSVVEWAEYQRKLPSMEEVKKWFSMPGVTGIAIITGSISGIIVLDTEKGADLSGLELPVTVTVKSGGGGLHYYFKCPKDLIIKNSVKKIREKIDMRAEGGYILVPPSTHLSGNRYGWSDGCSLDRDKIADIPNWLNEEIKSNNHVEKNWKEIVGGVEEGQRNESATSLIGKLLSYLPLDDWEIFGWEFLKLWNEKRNMPPLAIPELRAVFDSIAYRERDKRHEVVDRREADLKSLGELMGIEFPKIMWRIESMLPIAGKGIFSGVAGVGKSWILAELARCVALGVPFLGKFPVAQTNVLILDEDMGFQELQRRWKQLPNVEDLHSKIFFLSLTNLRLDSKDDIQCIQKVIESNNIGLLIIDPLIGTHSFDENDAKAMRKFFDQFKEFKIKNISILFAHHHRKQSFLGRKNLLEGIRGSSGIVADIESALAVEEDGEFLVISQTKNRNAEKLKPFQIKRLDEGGKTIIRYEGECDPKKLKKDEAKNLIQSLLRHETGLSATEIKEKLKNSGIGKSNIDEALKELIENYELRREKVVGQGNAYSYMSIVDKDGEKVGSETPITS